MLWRFVQSSRSFRPHKFHKPHEREAKSEASIKNIFRFKLNTNRSTHGIYQSPRSRSRVNDLIKVFISRTQCNDFSKPEKVTESAGIKKLKLYVYYDNTKSFSPIWETSRKVVKVERRNGRWLVTIRLCIRNNRIKVDRSPDGVVLIRVGPLRKPAD